MPPVRKSQIKNLAMTKVEKFSERKSNNRRKGAEPYVGNLEKTWAKCN